MPDGLIRGTIQGRWERVPLPRIIVRERQRRVDPKHVAEIRKSFAMLGGQFLLQPVVLDGEYGLIDGAHRLQAASEDGWSDIDALVFDGATEEDRPLLEAEANRVRKQLAPLEIEEAWRRYYEPAFKARAQRNQLGALRQGSDVPVTGIASNGNTDAPRTIQQAAVAATGLSIDTINKITDIRSFAESLTAPEELRAAAQRALKKLADPRVAVDPVYKGVLKMQELLAKKSVPASEARERELEARLDRTLTETSLLQEKLGGALGDDLYRAASVNQVAAETLRAVRVSLGHALAAVVVIECKLEQDHAAALSRIGGEVTKMLSQLSIAALRLDGERDE